MFLGSHESTAGGFFHAYEGGVRDGAEAIQVFTRSSRMWRAKPIGQDDVTAWNAARTKSGIAHVFCHDSYLINLAAEPGDLRDKSLNAFTEELLRCDQLGIPYLVAHPGAHVDEKRGLKLIAEGIDACFQSAKGAKTGVLLENTAGQGSSLGWTFSHLAEILAQCKHESRVGICIDSCHTFAAGYDLADAKKYEAIWNEFDATVGLSRVRAFHLNDCKKPLGCRVDRHEEIGKGTLGESAFARLVCDARFANVPGVIELPERLRENIDVLKRLRG